MKVMPVRTDLPTVKICKIYREFTSSMITMIADATNNPPATQTTLKAFGLCASVRTFRHPMRTIRETPRTATAVQNTGTKCEGRSIRRKIDYTVNIKHYRSGELRANPNSRNINRPEQVPLRAAGNGTKMA